MTNGAGFTNYRRNPCPGGMLHGNFPPMRGLLSAEVDTDMVDLESLVPGDLLLTTGGYKRLRMQVEFQPRVL